jgi:hypothetical protein
MWRTPPFEVADILRAAGKSFVEKNRSWLSWQHVRVLRATERCRSTALGGHIDQCSRCGTFMDCAAQKKGK